MTFTPRRKLGILRRVVNQFHKAYNTLYIMNTTFIQEKVTTRRKIQDVFREVIKIRA